MTQTCKHCRWYGGEDADNEGPCRLEPPVARAMEINGELAVYSLLPTVDADSTCSRWEMRQDDWQEDTASVGTL